MTTEMEQQNANSEERSEIHGPDDPGRQSETGNPVSEERGIEGTDTSPGSAPDVSDGDNEHADMRERDEVLCPTVPCPGDAADSIDAARGASESSNVFNSLIVIMSLLDVRIRIEYILQEKAKYRWQYETIDVRNSYAEMYENGLSTFEIARQYCEYNDFDPALCHDIYNERNQLC
jgi:hypothetical protein